MITVLLFLAVLFVLVLVHEWGHYIVAKKTGMRVDEFGIGFPPRLFGIRRGETDYTLNALPLGGFVRIYGEALVHSESEERDPDHHRAMWSRPRWAQALVLVAGVVMNIVLAWCLYVMVFLIGPTAVDETQASENAVLLITSVLPAGPLYEEILPGTQLLNIEANGASPATLSPRTVTAFIQDHPDTEVVLTLRDTETGAERLVTTRPVPGLVSANPERVAIGVGLSLVEPEGLPIVAAISRATAATWYGLTAITAGIGALLGGLVTGDSDLSAVAGPVGIAGMVGDAAALGITPLFTFVAIISLNLAVINMLPFPALDGGRLLLLLGEVIFRRPANQAWVTRLNAAGFVLLMIFMVVVTYNDLLRLFN